MAEYKLYKVNTLPVTLEPNSLYFVKEGDRFRQVLTDIAGVAVEGRQLSWSEILSTPTTIAGYGITDSYTSSEVDGFVSTLNSAIDGKVDDNQVLTNVPAGALFTDTIYTHPTNPNFNTDLNGATVFQNITTSNGHITGMTIRSMSPSNIGAEPAFGKSTGFNKNFGTAAGTVAEGNHNHFRNVTPLGGDNFTTTLNRNSTNLVTWYNTTGVGRSLTIGTGWLKNDEIEGSYTGASTLPISGGSGVTILVPDGLTAVIPKNGVYGIKFISDNVGVLFGTLIPV